MKFKAYIMLYEPLSEYFIYSKYIDNCVVYHYNFNIETALALSITEARSATNKQYVMFLSIKI